VSLSPSPGRIHRRSFPSPGGQSRFPCLNLHPEEPLPPPSPEEDFTSRPVVFDGIVQQIGENPGQILAVGGDRRKIRGKLQVDFDIPFPSRSPSSSETSLRSAESGSFSFARRIRPACIREMAKDPG
jgi:hypothetical protein